MSNTDGQSTTQSIATASVQPQRSTPDWIRPRIWLPTTLTFLAAAALWQLVATLNPYILPKLDAVFMSLVGNPKMYWENFLVTGQEILIGASGGILAGFILAIIMCEFNIVERALMPLVVVVMVTPVIAIAPALVTVFGFSPIPKYIVTGIVVFFPVLVNSLAGLRGVDPRALDVMRTLHASRWEIFRDLRFPGSMPFVFAGLRTALPLAVVGAAVAEFVAAGTQAGLGSLVTVAAAQANLVVTWAAIFLLCVTGILLIIILEAVRKPVLWWSDGEVTAQ